MAVNSNPRPRPNPNPQPKPNPRPSPQPDAEPSPNPNPTPTPTPTPQPYVEPQPVSQPVAPGTPSLVVPKTDISADMGSLEIRDPATLDTGEPDVRPIVSSGLGGIDVKSLIEKVAPPVRSTNAPLSAPSEMTDPELTQAYISMTLNDVAETPESVARREAIEAELERRGGSSDTGTPSVEQPAVAPSKKKARSTGKPKTSARETVAPEEAPNEAAPEAPRPDRLIAMTQGTDLIQVIVEAIRLYGLLLNKTITPKQVFARLGEASLWDNATDEGKVGLRLILGFARGIDGKVDRAVETFRDAIIETRRIAGDKIAHRLYERISENVTKETKKKLAKAIRDVTEIPEDMVAREESPQEANPEVSVEQLAEIMSKPYQDTTKEEDRILNTAPTELVQAAQAMVQSGIQAAPLAAEADEEFSALDEMAPVTTPEQDVRMQERIRALLMPNAETEAFARQFENEILASQEADVIVSSLGYRARRDAGLPIEEGSAYATSPDAVLDAMFPSWLEAKDEAARVRGIEERQNVYNAAERVETLATLEALSEYLTEKENQTEANKPWVGRIRIMMEDLLNPDIPFCALDAKAIHDDLMALYAIIDEDLKQAKIAKAHEAWRKNKGAVDDGTPKPRGWPKIVKMRRKIQENLQTGVVPLSGDHTATRKRLVIEEVLNRETGELEKVFTEVDQEYIEHSEPVKAAIAHTLRSAGYKDESQYEALERWLFIAFQLYRGASIDQNERWFGEKKDVPTITDLEFIVALSEIVSNAKTKGHPFAYLHPEAELGGTPCFPMPMTPGLAGFFSKHSGEGTLNPHGLTKQEMVDYSVNQWNDTIHPLVLEQPAPQREVLLNFADAIVEFYPEMAGATLDGKPGLQIRTPDQRVTLEQAYQVGDAWAEAHTAENDLASAAIEDKERITRSTAKIKKRRQRKNDQSKLSSRIDRVATGIMEIGILNQLVGKAGGWLLASGVVEKVTGLSGMNFVMHTMIQAAAKRAAADPTGQTIDPTVSKSFLEAISKTKNVDALLNAMKIAGGPMGIEGVVVAGSEGALYEQDAFIKMASEVKDESVADQLVQYAKSKVQGTGHMLTTISIGDFVGNPHTARLWLRAYCLYMSEADVNGRVAKSPEELENMFTADPAGFLNEALQRPEGLAALKLAGQASLAGYNLFTAALANVVDTPVKRLLFGWFVTLFGKYGINILLRHLPGSTLGMYCAKKGFNGVMVRAAEKKGFDEALKAATARGLTGDALAEAATIGASEARANAEGLMSDSDLLMIGGQSKSFWNGAYQCMLVDMMNLGTDVAIFGFLMAAVTFFGVDPPDDEGDEDYQGKLLRYDEYKIGGQIIKANWFWGDLLGFAMPAIIAIHAGIAAEKRGEDGNAFAWKVFTYGCWDVMQENTWVRMLGIFDVLNDFRASYDQELNRSEGTDIKQQDFIALTIRSFMIRRSIAFFEPALLREIYTETGLFGGTPHLDVSSTTIFTRSMEDDPDKVESNPSYADIRLRRDIKNSPIAGFLANLLTGYYAPEVNVDRTGYMRSDRPFVTNVEPFSQMWVDKLTPRTEEGTPIEYDPKKPEQFAEVVALLRPLIETDKYSPQVLRGSGVVIPKNARLAMDDILYQEAAALWKSYYDRDAAGEWIVKGEFDADKVIAAKTAKQAEYARIEKLVARRWALREKLWDKQIPYDAWKMNRILTNFREIVVWKEGPNAGEVAPPWAAEFNKDEVEVRLYPTGEHKTNWLPYTKVDDVGDPSYDARAAVPWYNEFSDEELIESSAKGYIIPDGLGAGEELLSVMTGGGATGLNQTKFGGWVNEYLFPARGYLPVPRDPVEQELPEWNFDDLKKSAPPATDAGSSGDWSGGGGGGEYAPNIYSHAPQNLNADKPAGLYTKIPSYARFDYLRPSVETKGSREAYRREDF